MCYCVFKVVPGKSFRSNADCIVVVDSIDRHTENDSSFFTTEQSFLSRKCPKAMTLSHEKVLKCVAFAMLRMSTLLCSDAWENINYECRNDPRYDDQLPWFEYKQQWEQFIGLWNVHEDTAKLNDMWIGLK